MCRVLATLAQCECFSLKCNIVTNSGDVNGLQKRRLFTCTLSKIYIIVCVVMQ